MDMLEFAINMELEGQQYYESQASLHPKDGLKVVFELLAGEEGGHAALLKSRRDGVAFRLKEAERPVLKNIFDGNAAFRSDIKDVPSQVDAYQAGLVKEQQSIDLYKKLLSENGADREFYEFLIRQEEEHYAILEEIIKLVNRPNTWVEAAEFGLREEY